MNGMRTKGADYETSFGPLTASKGVELPLGRLQRVADVNGVSGNTPSELKKNGEIKFTGTYNQCLEWLHQNTSYSWDHAIKYEGWTIEPTTATKTAAIYDNYGTRVTIETKAGDTNESYTMVLSMLKSADILYRELKRYTINPDRVVLEVIVRDQDLDVVKELAKEAEKEGVKIYLSDNISESIKSKVIVTEEDEVEKKVEASKKTATTGNEWASMFQDVGINIGQADILWDKINTLGGSLTFDNYVSAGNKSEMIATLSKLADTLQLALASVAVLSGELSEEGQEPEER